MSAKAKTPDAQGSKKKNGHGGKRAGAGGPPHVPTDETRKMVAVAMGAMTEDQIAAALDIDAKTLRKHYKVELRTGKAKRDARIVGNLMKQSDDGNVAATIFYLKTQLGWKETQRLEHTGLSLGELVTGSQGGAGE